MSDTKTRREWIEFLHQKMLSDEPIEYFGESVFITEHQETTAYHEGYSVPKEVKTVFTLSNGNTIKYIERV